MTRPPDLPRRISGSLLRLRRKSPFFGALSLFARFVPRDDIPTACTDGKQVFYNPTFLADLPAATLDAVVLHELLHAALLHPVRVGARDPVRWNLAADIVVNGIVAADPELTLLAGAVREPTLEHLSVEEIYALVWSRPIDVCPHCMRPLEGGIRGDLAAIEAYWRSALRQAEVVARSVGQGQLSAGIERIIGQLAAPQIDWRTQLWRFLVRTPTDFGDFDRRFLHAGLYLETLASESLHAYLAIDTSGSISTAQLTLFQSEILAILRAYPHVRLELYHADAELYGPYDLDASHELPPPRGGGGTRFEPFFERIESEAHRDGEAVLIYLTDGYGSFPAEPPSHPVLWIVTAGGAREEAFPFGSVLRLVDDGVG